MIMIIGDNNDDNDDNKILKYNFEEKSLKFPAIINAEVEFFFENMHSSRNNLEKPYTEKKTKHTPSGYLLFTNCSFHLTENKLECQKVKDCMERFCKDLRVHIMKIINYEKKERIPPTNEDNEYYDMQKVSQICKKEFNTDKNDKNVFKLYHKVKDHCHCTGKYKGAAHSICNLSYKIPKEIPVVFHNGSTYDYHFIIKQLAKEFDGQFECLGENAEKYITFSVPIKKELGSSKTITYKLKFIDSFRFMSTSLSRLIDNLSDGFHCNRYIDCKFFLDYMITQDDQLIFRCFECKKNYHKVFNKDLINRFAKIYEFCNNGINRLILLLRKGIYLYESIDS